MWLKVMKDEVSLSNGWTNFKLSNTCLILKQALREMIVWHNYRTEILKRYSLEVFADFLWDLFKLIFQVVESVLQNLNLRKLLFIGQQWPQTFKLGILLLQCRILTLDKWSQMELTKFLSFFCESVFDLVVVYFQSVSFLLVLQDLVVLLG